MRRDGVAGVPEWLQGRAVYGRGCPKSRVGADDVTTQDSDPLAALCLIPARYPSPIDPPRSAGQLQLSAITLACPVINCQSSVFDDHKEQSVLYEDYMNI
jgi:hypothetical protein